MLAGVHAWLYKQERVLLIFDNCNMDRSDRGEGTGRCCALSCVVPSCARTLARRD